jgi:hypothetical protein
VTTQKGSFLFFSKTQVSGGHTSHKGRTLSDDQLVVLGDCLDIGRDRISTRPDAALINSSAGIVDIQVLRLA